MIVLKLGSLRMSHLNIDYSCSPWYYHRLGFHVPPFNSVNHLHMHVIGLPFKNKIRSYKYKPGYPWYADAKTVLDRLGEGMSPVWKRWLYVGNFDSPAKCFRQSVFFYWISIKKNTRNYNTLEWFWYYKKCLNGFKNLMGSLQIILWH